MSRLPAVLLAALLGTAACPAAAQYGEPALGRLFTIPAERMQLDRDRATMAARTSAAAAQPAPPLPAAPVAAPPPPPAAARLTGVVRRGDGRATIWLDDEPHETTLDTYRPGGPVPIDTPGGRVLVKPGQSYDPASGTVQDAR